MMKTNRSEDPKKTGKPMHRAGVVIWPRRAEGFHAEWVQKAFTDHSKFEVDHWEANGRVVGLICGFSDLFDEVPLSEVGLYRMGFVEDQAIAFRVDDRLPRGD